MTLAQKTGIIGITLLLSLAGFIAILPTIAKANPSFFLRQQSAAATSTPIAYMTAGTATSTLAFDTGASAAGSTDTASLLECFQASSTSATLNTTIEYSQDNATWYQNEISELATTSSTLSIGAVQNMSWPFASTSIGGAAVLSTNNFGCKIATVKTPTRWVRAVLSLPAGSTNGAAYAEFVAKRQAN